MMVLSIGLSYLAGQILAKGNESPVEKDKPTTLTKRGSYMSWFCGIRRVGPVFAWAGDREIREEEAEGGKGAGGQDVEVFYEAGWHQIATGPCDALHRIVQGGKTIFQGPITRDSHPSGTTVDLGKEGTFTIYWGEDDQPINTFLGNANRVGISSRWPFCCYVVWNKKRLSTSPNWPIIDYVMERRPSQSVVTGCDAWYDPTATLDGETFDVVDYVANANEDLGYLEVQGNATAPLDPSRIARVSGNGMGTGDFTVLRTEVKTVQTGTTPSGYPLYETRTEVYFEGGTVGADDQGTIQAYTFATDDGANVAHAIAELLFAPWPQGLSIDPAGAEVWDIPSLNALGAEAETEDWRASLVSVNGEDADSILGAVLQDHGVMLPIDTQTGFLTFASVREPTGTLENFPADLYAKLPEIETMHGAKKSSRLVFEFADRDNDFGTMTIAIMSAGEVSYLEHARANNVPIPSVTHFATAAALTEMRSQEELGGGGEFRLKLKRKARDLIPGQAIVVEGFDEVLRVLGVTLDPLSEEVELSVMPDVYGVARSDFVNDPGGGGTNFQDPANDEQFVWVEVPEALLATEQMYLLAPRIRAHSEILSSAIHLSRDNTTYTFVSSHSGYATGGTLDAAFSDDTNTFLAQGPEFTLLGPDASSAQDLSADSTNWGLGRQLAVIVSTAGTEICFLQKITALGGDTYRLDGLLRGRYDTRRLDHPTGAQVYIFSDTALKEIQDLLLGPAEDLYAKSQPFTTAGSVPLEGVPPYSEELRGKGLVPIDVENIRTSAPWKNNSAYGTGDAVTVEWSWFSAASRNTGAGYQSAGSAIGAPTLKGSFIVELLTTGDVVVQTDTVTDASITYSNALLSAAPISEGNFKVRITHSYNGYLSTPVTRIITKV